MVFSSFQSAFLEFIAFDPSISALNWCGRDPPIFKMSNLGVEIEGFV